jgi:uncharacterized protein (DUF1501 family)
MNRRELLKLLAALPASGLAGRLIAAPAAQSRLLIVFLRGAYDCANLLVPVSSSFYYESRPNISIAKPIADSDSQNPNAALPLDANWGLHPALRDSLLPLYLKGQLAFVPFAGIDDLTRSHFETQDSIEMGQALNQQRNFRSGFMNRLARVMDATGQSRPISFTDQLPLVFRGDAQVPNLALKNIGKPGVDARQAQIIATMYRDTPLAATVSEGFGVRDEVMRSLNAEMDQASRNAISTKGFELEARRIALLMREKFNLGFVDVGGWDTHVAEGGATGYLATRLEELGRGLAAYADAMGPDWQNSTVVVVSEFGRTFRENGNRGTDHGHGSVYWVLGGSVRGGRIVGEQVPLIAANLFQNRDYPVLNEYRALLGGLMARQFSLSAAQVDQVFPGAPARDFGLL